jgi:hypothetical protein
MTLHSSFQGLSSSVMPSQDHEVLIAKQSALSSHGQQTRILLSKLPPSVVDTLVADYKAPNRAALDSVFTAIAEREQIIDSAQKGKNLDVEWLQAGAETSRRMDEIGLGSDDPWNSAPSI